MDATDLCYTPATELRRMIDAKAVSPVEIADAVLARIERLNPTLNAFLTVTYDIARDDARAAEARQLRGERLTPIDGIPFSIKDLEPTAGVRTTFGSKWFEENVPTVDGVAAGRLRRAAASSSARPTPRTTATRTCATTSSGSRARTPGSSGARPAPRRESRDSARCRTCRTTASR